MADTPIRVYADTSVFGGVFDDEFEDVSRRFFEEVEAGRFRVVVSALVEEELQVAPSRVRDFFEAILLAADLVGISAEALRLQRAYLDAGILTPNWASDALHVALATVSGCSVIVSWNFQHIVHFEKILLYNAANTIKGYPAIAIHSPREVVSYENEDI